MAIRRTHVPLYKKAKKRAAQGDRPARMSFRGKVELLARVVPVTADYEKPMTMAATTMTARAIAPATSRYDAALRSLSAWLFQVDMP